MDEPTALLPPVSTLALSELLENGPMPLQQGLELLGVIAGQLAKLHANARTHGLLTAQVIRVQTFESGPPVVVLIDPGDQTRDMTEGADLWALGVLAFQVLAGRMPRQNETLAQVLPEAPPALERLVSRLMSAKPNDRLPAAGAQRQLLDLAGTAADPKAKAAAPLGALPQIKRGVPIGAQKTAAHAWVRERDPDLTPPPPPPKPARTAPPPQQAAANPFGDDEATAMVPPRSTAPDPPPIDGPAMDDEPTQFEPVKRMRRPLAPPVPTPLATRAVAEPTTEAFEPSRSDLPGNTGEPMIDPRLAPRRKKRNPEEHSPLSELMHTAKGLPPWAWGAIGVGLAFFVLLLIALLR